MKTTKFKPSEIGPIPEEWEVRRYEQVFNHIPSKDYQVQSDQYLEGGRFPIVDQGQEDVIGYTDEDTHLFSVPDGGVIIFGDHTRIVKYRCRDFVVGADGTQLLTGKEASTKFLSYRLRELDIPNLGYSRHFKYVKDALYLMPPRAEQEKIAAALSDVDELLAAMTALIEKKRAIKKGAMQELLEVRPTALTQRTQSAQRGAKCFSHGERGEHGDGFKTGLTGFTGLRDDSRGEVDQTSNSSLRPFANSAFSASAPAGANPVNPVNPVEKNYAPRRRLAGFTGAWVERRFDDCFDIISNNTYAREFMCSDESGVANIHYGDVLIKYGSVLDFAKSHVDSLRFSVLIKSENLKDGDLIIADTAEDETVGKAVEIQNLGTRRAVAGLHTVACRPKMEFAPEWLGYYINSNDYHDQLLPLITGIKVSSISKAGFRQTILHIPTLAEQKAIAGVLADMDAEIAALESKRAKYEQIKQGMMQELLTGKTRLEA